nr:hypothetical protein [Tanacetum cinerariifolium]
PLRNIPIPNEPSTSKPQKKNKLKRKHSQEPEVLPTESSAKHNLPSPSHYLLPSESEVIDIRSTYQARIEKLERRVERLEEEKKAYNLDLDHQEKVLSMLDDNDEEPANVEEVLKVVKDAKLIIEVVTTAGVDVNAASVQDTLITAAEATKVSVPRKRRDEGKAILIKEPKPLKRQAQIELDEEVTRQLEAELNVDVDWNVVIENMIVYLKNMAGYKMNYFKGMTYDEIRPLFEKQYNYNQAFLNEVNEEFKVPKREVRQEKEVEVESSKREGKSLEKEVAKKQKMKQETEELRKCLQIVPDDDDVYTDATPFTMLKNFNREDLESLWNIIKERFAKTEPKNYSDDFLLNFLKIMFEKPNVEANMWKIFLLVERMYPLTHFTLEQMINDVRLEVEDESEMSLELLRLVKRQSNEGYVPQ